MRRNKHSSQARNIPGLQPTPLSLVWPCIRWTAGQLVPKHSRPNKLDLIIFYVVRTSHAHNNVSSTAFLVFCARGVAHFRSVRVSRLRAVSLSRLLSGLASRQCLYQTQCPTFWQHRLYQPEPNPSARAASPCRPTYASADHALELATNKRFGHPGRG